LAADQGLAFGHGWNGGLWSNYLDGGLAVGMRIPIAATMSLQPYAGFDSFIPVLGTKTVDTAPGEKSTKFITGSRCNIPEAGLRVSLEL
jgi:hypothetical protein